MKRILLLNSKGISVLFLIIAMLLMVTIGYVFSYLIPAKQKSVVFPIQSTQAFFIAQSGVEFAVRYATENNWMTPLQLTNLNGVSRNLGPGRFTLTYTNVAPKLDTLTSVGEVQVGARRQIQVSNFTQFLAQPGLVLWIEPPTYPEPCWYLSSNRNIRFYIKNTGGSTVVLNRFSATWTTPPNNRAIQSITIGSNGVFSGSYLSGSGIQFFTPSGNKQSINPNQVISVLVIWNLNISGQTPINLSFYDSTGVEFQFVLQPAINCP